MKNENNLPCKTEHGTWNLIRTRIKKFLIFLKDRKKNKINEKEFQECKSENNGIIMESKKVIMGNAQKAYKNYILNSNPDIIKTAYDLIKQKIVLNEKNIIALLKMEKSDFSYLDIMKILNSEEENIKQFKKSIYTEKLDNKFIYSEYQVPTRNNRNDFK